MHRYLLFLLPAALTLAACGQKDPSGTAGAAPAADSLARPLRVNEVLGIAIIEPAERIVQLAAEAGTPFSGVLCGRATWQDGIPVYAKQGYDALVAWLEDRGVQNIKALNEGLAKGAQPWWDFYGGKANIEVV